MQDAFFLSVHELLESKGPYIPKVRPMSLVLYQSYSNSSQKSLTAEKQPDGFKGIKLYKYQLDAISWMKSVENDLINNSISFCRAIPWRQARSDVMLYGNPQDYSGKREFVLPENVSSYVSKFKPRGGILADEMGLGKTMEGKLMAL
jgi:SNF2 family DNA or RNA helicase